MALFAELVVALLLLALLVVALLLLALLVVALLLLAEEEEETLPPSSLFALLVEELFELFAVLGLALLLLTEVPLLEPRSRRTSSDDFELLVEAGLATLLELLAETGEVTLLLLFAVVGVALLLLLIELVEEEEEEEE